MKKALEILNILFKKEYTDKIEIPFNDFIEAINEIEEAMKPEKPNSCDGCIWDSKYGCTVMLVCIRHPLNIDRYSPMGIK